MLVEQVLDLGEVEGQNLILEEERTKCMDWEAILVTEVVRFLPMGTSARFEYTSESYEASLLSNSALISGKE